MVGDDFGKFLLDVLGVDGLASKTSESAGSLVEFSSLDEVSGRLREEEETATEDESPGELQTNWDTVRTSVAAVLSTVVNTGGEEKTESYAKLVPFVFR